MFIDPDIGLIAYCITEIYIVIKIYIRYRFNITLYCLILKKLYMQTELLLLMLMSSDYNGIKKGKYSGKL